MGVRNLGIIARMAYNPTFHPIPGLICRLSKFQVRLPALLYVVPKSREALKLDIDTLTSKQAGYHPLTLNRRNPKP